MAEPVEDVDPVQIALLEIEKYIKKTLGEEIKADEYDKNIEDRFTDPNEKESTEYGEIKPEEEEPYRQSQVQDPEYTFVGQGYLY
jgi:pyruvate/2-oxoacid:ferredoxin oxidoreductase alpha subunit